jgi:hypothetical protein
MPASNTYDTSSPGSASLNREQLADYVTTLAPEKSPVTSLCSRGVATAVEFGWGVDKLESPSSDGVAEGATQTNYADAYSGLARLTNNIQEFRRAKRVTDWQEAVDKAGVQGIASAEVKAVKELKRDVEMTLCSTNDKVSPAGDGTVAKTRGLGDWIDSGGPSDVPSDYRTPSGSIHASGTFNETALKDIITSIYRQDGMDADLNLVADTALRRIITGFAESTGGTNTTSRVVNQDADGSLKSTVSYYESDNGIVRVMNMNPVCAPDTTNKDTGYFIPSGSLVLRELIPLNASMEPKRVGGQEVVVQYVAGLEVKHPGALGKITTLS